MLNKYFDKQREKAISTLEEKFPYWKFKGDLFDKPKQKLIEFYQVSESLKKVSDCWMGKVTHSLEPDYPLQNVIVVYTHATTYMHICYDSIEIYNSISSNPDIKKL